MNVLAVRDDGALLVVDGPAAIVAGPDGGAWLTSRDAALARGDWEPSTADVPKAAQLLAPQLTAYSRELAEQQQRLNA